MLAWRTLSMVPICCQSCGSQDESHSDPTAARANLKPCQICIADEMRIAAGLHTCNPSQAAGVVRGDERVCSSRAAVQLSVEGVLILGITMCRRR